MSAFIFPGPDLSMAADGQPTWRMITQAGVQFVVTFDTEDEHFLDERTWQVEKNGNTFYLRVSHHDSAPGDRPLLHRLILDVGPGFEVDHINGDGLDNRKVNLRKATRAQNAANRVKGFPAATSQFKGVYWRRSSKRWIAQISVSNKVRHLGSFATEEEAARCYDAAALLAFDGFARLNYPREVAA